MYSAKVLEHLENPRNAGEIENADACGESTNPVCGDILKLFIRLDGQTIAEAGFLVQGCPPSIAAGSVLTEMIKGKSPAEAAGLAPGDVTAALDSLPRNKQHCSILAIDALRDALHKLR